MMNAMSYELNHAQNIFTDGVCVGPLQSINDH